MRSAHLVLSLVLVTAIGVGALVLAGFAFARADLEGIIGGVLGVGGAVIFLAVARDYARQLGRVRRGLPPW